MVVLKLWICTALKQSPLPSHVTLHFAYSGNLFSVEDLLGEQCSLVLGVSLLALRNVAWTSVQVSAPAVHLLKSIALLSRDFCPTNWQWWLLCRDTLGREFWFLSILVRLCDFFACNVLEISIVYCVSISCGCARRLWAWERKGQGTHHHARISLRCGNDELSCHQFEHDIRIGFPKCIV